MLRYHTSYVDITTFFFGAASRDLIAVLEMHHPFYHQTERPPLHEPMYYFLSMLTMSTWVSLSTPNSHSGFSVLSSSVLTDHVIDRYLIAQIGIVFSFKSMFLVLPFPFTLRSLRYCKKNQLSHSYCLHQDVMKLACSDNRIDVIYSFFGALCLMVDFIFIAMSYILILKTLLGIASKKEHLKALNTCVSHICAVIIFYLPIITLAVVHHFVQHVSPIINVLMANVLLLVPPLMNPIVYCLKTKQIRVRVVAKLCQRKI
uniref:G-protein coupled receptors family 1 profile domain-containing protein n=1 Tax=Rhinopithecus bieti TaxID=61621 RepID=A0A2K6KKB0_RHIBE